MKSGNQVHRTRARERDDGDDILEPVGLEPHQQVAHAGAFQLEHARRFTGGEQLERRLIVEGQLFDPQRRLVGAALVDNDSAR